MDDSSLEMGFQDHIWIGSHSQVFIDLRLTTPSLEYYAETVKYG